MTSLSEVHRAVAALRDLPPADRLEQARGLAPRLDRVLVDGRISADTARQLWTRLVRAVHGGATAAQSPEDARAEALAVLGLQGQDALGEVTRAAERDRQAARAAADAREALREAVRAARRDQVGVAALARAAGVSRTIVHQWTDSDG